MTKSSKPLFAFFGTPLFATRVLDALESHGMLPALVITAPDKPRGRGLEVQSSPAKEWALTRGIDVAQPTTLKDESFVAELKNTDWDVFVVAAYAKLIPKEVLTLPRRGSLNVHPSLLPKFRGPSPALSAILADERTSGVSIIEMDEELDHGRIVAQARIEIAEDEWPPRGSMYEDLLAVEGGNVLAEVLPEWIEGSIAPDVQDESKVTWTKKFTDHDALIDLSGDPRINFLKIRAFDKAPRAYFLNSKGKRVVVTDAAWVDGALVISRVIPEGKREMSCSDYLHGQKG